MRREFLDSRFAIHDWIGACSRQRPNAICTGRSDMLKSTASSDAWCHTGAHDGATKMSRGDQSNVVPAIVVLPCPSTAQKIVASVARYGVPLKPLGSSCMNAPIVGIV